MLTISKDGVTLKVTKGAYNSMYAPQGWVKIEGDEITNTEDDFSPTQFDEVTSLPETYEQNSENKPKVYEDETDDDETEGTDLSEIPLSQMTVPQLKKYAQQLGVKSNTESSKELRNRIRRVLSGE